MSKSKKEKKKVTVDNFDVKDFIVKTLRGAFRKSPLYSECLNRAKEEFFLPNKKDGELTIRRVHYKCAGCGRFFFRGKKQEGMTRKVNEIAVDHIIPVVDLVKGFTDMNDYVSRLFCDISNLQALCNYKGERDGVVSCHKKKTAEEKGISAAAKREAKNAK